LNAKHDVNEIFSAAVNLEWERIDSEKASSLRSKGEGFVLRDILIKQVQSLNPASVREELLESLIKQLELVPQNIHGNKDVWGYITSLKALDSLDAPSELDIRIFNMEQMKENVFHVTSDFKFTHGKECIVAELVYFINGIPVAASVYGSST